MENVKTFCSNYTEPKVEIIVFWGDIITFSGENNGEGNLGSDLGGGQIGGNDIFE